MLSNKKPNPVISELFVREESFRKNIKTNHDNWW